MTKNGNPSRSMGWMVVGTGAARKGCLSKNMLRFSYKILCNISFKSFLA